jgi:hypothetical protein
MIISARNINDGLTRTITKTGNKFLVTRHGGETPSSFLCDQAGLDKMFYYHWMWTDIKEEKDAVIAPKERKTGFEGEIEVREKKTAKPKVVQASLL